jgi:hypothetical protein
MEQQEVGYQLPKCFSLPGCNINHKMLKGLSWVLARFCHVYMLPTAGQQTSHDL